MSVYSIRSSSGGRSSSSSVRSCTLLLLPILSKTLTRQKTKEPHSVCASLLLSLLQYSSGNSVPHPSSVGGVVCSLGQKIRFRLVRPSSKDPRIKRDIRIVLRSSLSSVTGEKDERHWRVLSFVPSGVGGTSATARQLPHFPPHPVAENRFHFRPTSPPHQMIISAQIGNSTNKKKLKSMQLVI